MQASKELIHQTGALLYGDNWKSELARDLHVSAQTIYNYNKTPATIPPTVIDDCIKLLKQRQQAIIQVLDKYQTLMEVPIRG